MAHLSLLFIILGLQLSNPLDVPTSEAVAMTKEVFAAEVGPLLVHWL
jgi:hypothetical protein